MLDTLQCMGSPHNKELSVALRLEDLVSVWISVWMDGQMDHRWTDRYSVGTILLAVPYSANNNITQPVFLFPALKGILREFASLRRNPGAPHFQGCPVCFKSSRHPSFRAQLLHYIVSAEAETQDRLHSVFSFLVWQRRLVIFIPR